MGSRNEQSLDVRIAAVPGKALNAAMIVVLGTHSLVERGRATAHIVLVGSIVVVRIAVAMGSLPSGRPSRQRCRSNLLLTWWPSMGV